MANNDQSSNNIRFNEKTQALEYASGLNWNTVPGTGSSVVDSINGLDGAVTLAAGSNITLTPSGQTITIASSGGGGSSPNVQFAVIQQTNVPYSTSSTTYVRATDSSMELTFTASSVSSVVRISFQGIMGNSASGTKAVYTVFQDFGSTNVDLFDVASGTGGGNTGLESSGTAQQSAGMELFFVPGDTSAHTYDIMVKIQGGGSNSLNSGTFSITEVH